jgi:4-amino-4-deoxy-L-arabinose transferase-like glycosyltransferase
LHQTLRLPEETSMNTITDHSPIRERLRLVMAERTAGVSTYGRKVLYLIGFFTLLRLLVAFTLPLGNDESYYWLYSQRLQWNYFDHPPLVALWIRFFTANLSLDFIEGFVRLGSVMSAALSTWAIYQTVSLLHSPRAGWLAAVLYSLSFYASLIAGILIWPDSPQMLFWTLSLWMLARIFRNDRDWVSWLLFGLCSGLCIMSKVHGVFLWGGLVPYMLWKQRAWLLRPQVYASALTTLVLISPILIWNLQHDFITYRFHSERVGVERMVFNAKGFGEEVMGQLLFNNPVLVFLAISGLVMWRRRSFSTVPVLTVYNLIGLPLLVVLLGISLFRDTTLPHWSGPAYVTLIPLAALQLAAIDNRRFFPRLLRWGVGAFFLFFIPWNLVIHFYPGTYGSKAQHNLGWSDATLDLYGWEESGKAFAALYQKERAVGIMPPGVPLVCCKWWGAHVEYYFARPLGLPMIGLGTPENLHHYLWMNEQRAAGVDLSKAYCIVPSDEYYDAHRKYGAYYDSIEPVTTITTHRSGRPAHHFYVYRLSGWKGQVPMP